MKTLKLELAEPTRLDVALAAELGISRASAQKAIKDGRVSIDGKTVNAHLKVGPEVTIKLAAEKKVSTVELKKVPLNILFEDDDVIVVNKPASLLVHAAPGKHEYTLEDALLAYYPAIKKAGLAEKRNGIVHRLDKEASGVLVVAKNDKAFHFLKNVFSERLSEKTYTVLVNGNVEDQSGTINFPIARSRSRARMAARPESQEGKEAVTHFDVVKRYSSTTLLKVRIETGRTHQIRAHFFALGHPVVGDQLYVRRDIKTSMLSRLFLHSTELTLPLPNGESMTFNAPLPDELASYLKGLKAKPV